MYSTVGAHTECTHHWGFALDKAFVVSTLSHFHEDLYHPTSHVPDLKMPTFYVNLSHNIGLSSVGYRNQRGSAAAPDPQLL